MALSVLAISALALWDEGRESAAALEDFGREQTTTAQIAAAQLATQLDVIRRDAYIVADDVRSGVVTPPGVISRYASLRVRQRGEAAPRPDDDPQTFLVSVPVPDGRTVDVVVRASRLLEGMRPLDAPDTLVALRPPHERRLQSATGLSRSPERVLRALEARRGVEQLSREDAAALGLPARAAVAGLARLDAGPLGEWGVAVIASTGPERDRQTRARVRLVCSVLLACGLVLAFGGRALRAQRKELDLARELALAELEQRRDEQLERESRAATMVTLAAGVAHEVSTPLGVVLGRAEQILERAGGDERVARGAQIILEHAARIQSVLRGFLKLARGDAPVLERIDPAAVVRGAVALVEHRFAKAGVRLGVEVPVGLPMIRGDQRLLEHAVVNLLLNACDASLRGGTVAIHARAEQSCVAFCVEDEGVGIDPANVARVMEPFFTTKPAGQGTGLGLAVANEIVKIHRGTLAFAPRSPRGTTATVRVPIESTE